MRRWLIITGAVACAIAGNAANARQGASLARSNEAIDQTAASPSSGPFGRTNSWPPAAVSRPSHDIVAGATFVGRDPDRHIRFQILRDSKF
jgi:hypothetical protein